MGVPAEVRSTHVPDRNITPAATMATARARRQGSFSFYAKQSTISPEMSVLLGGLLLGRGCLARQKRLKDQRGYHERTDTHTHDQSAYLLITEGTATLGVETAAGMVSTNLGPGSTIEVPAGCRHFEQAGAAPVKFLAALK